MATEESPRSGDVWKVISSETVTPIADYYATVGSGTVTIKEERKPLVKTNYIESTGILIVSVQVGNTIKEMNAYVKGCDAAYVGALVAQMTSNLFEDICKEAEEEVKNEDYGTVHITPGTITVTDYGTSTYYTTSDTTPNPFIGEEHKKKKRWFEK